MRTSSKSACIVSEAVLAKRIRPGEVRALNCTLAESSGLNWCSRRSGLEEERDWGVDVALPSSVEGSSHGQGWFQAYDCEKRACWDSLEEIPPITYWLDGQPSSLAQQCLAVWGSGKTVVDLLCDAPGYSMGVICELDASHGLHDVPLQARTSTQRYLDRVALTVSIRGISMSSCPPAPEHKLDVSIYKGGARRSHGGVASFPAHDQSKFAVESLSAHAAEKQKKMGKKQRENLRMQALEETRKLSEPLVLHPSWRARRELLKRMHRTRFKGKLVKFDSDGDPVLRLHRGKAKLLKELKPIATPAKVEEKLSYKSERKKEKLNRQQQRHPSWQAKDKMRREKLEKEAREKEVLRKAFLTPHASNNKIRFD
ncbi:unnamed protein product [Cyprideis torosa]|uniref:Uncharacterized protein n=1 Tax=Cyprideis torosa TaxID=163714 RepID=A0A7R8WHL2_9CRUS|nr:unnamed protein product [Cyprideis torosa]CAG0894294.1 unnamed protein product [Cyprideis torosa]